MDTNPSSIPPLPSDPSLPSPLVVPPPPVHHPSKLLWLLTGLTILILGILVGFFGSNIVNQSNKQISTLPQNSSTGFSTLSSPTPLPAADSIKGGDPTANWKTYTNTQFRYSIKYPNGWNAKSFGPGAGYVPLDNVQRGLLLTPQAPATGMGIPMEDINIRIEADSAHTSGMTYEAWIGDLKKNDALSTFSISETTLASTKTVVIQKKFSVVYLLPSPDRSLFYFMEVRSPTPDYKDTLDQILSTFQFLNPLSPSPTPTTLVQSSPTQSNGADLKTIRYTLPTCWGATLNADNLHLAPKSGGGYLYIEVFNYPSTTGRRDYYCQLRKYCIPETVFTETTIGNISGYRATRLDNSGGGGEYFGAKGNKFYIIGTYSPPAPNDFDNNYKSVLSSLMF